MTSLLLCELMMGQQWSTPARQLNYQHPYHFQDLLYFANGGAERISQFCNWLALCIFDFTNCALEYLLEQTAGFSVTSFVFGTTMLDSNHHAPTLNPSLTASSFESTSSSSTNSVSSHNVNPATTAAVAASAPTMITIELTEPPQQQHATLSPSSISQQTHAQEETQENLSALSPPPVQITFQPPNSPMPPRPPTRNASVLTVQPGGGSLRGEYNNSGLVLLPHHVYQQQPVSMSPSMPSILAPVIEGMAADMLTDQDGKAPNGNGLYVLQGERAVHLRRTNVGLLDCFCRCLNFNHQFDVRSRGTRQLLMTITEHSTTICRVGCGPNRAFHAALFAPSHPPIVGTEGSVVSSVSDSSLATVQRDTQLGTWLPCLPCIQQKAHVIDSRTGSLLGTLTTDSLDCLRPCVRITDDMGQEVVITRGPCCVPHVLCYWCEQTFQILDVQNQQKGGSEGGVHVGSIVKQMSGLWREVCTDADNYEITFPTTASIGMKVLLIMATFYIDMRYFDV